VGGQKMALAIFEACFWLQLSFPFSERVPNIFQHVRKQSQENGGKF
jgi:hypothetical protein